ncbi:MAG: TonB family protein [Rhodanobacteraceae bacterium]
MKRVGWLLALVFASTLAGAAERQPEDVTLSWRIDLNEKGAIQSLEPINPEYMQALQKRLEPAIRNWHFTTGKVNGQPAPTTTTLTLRMGFESIGNGDFNVRLRRASTGAYYKHLVQPRYPDYALSAHRGAAAVMLQVDFDANGKVTSAVPVAGGVPEPRKVFNDAAISAVTKWTFTPESIAGHGLSGKVLVPVCFSVAQTTCRWHRDGEDRPIDGNSPLSLTSVVQIDTDVVGSTL